jgi:hypothetical protein
MSATGSLADTQVDGDLLNANWTTVRNDPIEAIAILLVAGDVLQKPQIDRPRATRIDSLDMPRVEESGRHGKCAELAGFLHQPFSCVGKRGRAFSSGARASDFVSPSRSAAGGVDEVGTSRNQLWRTLSISFVRFSI